MHKKLDVRNSVSHRENPDFLPVGNRFGRRPTQTKLATVVDETDPDPADLLTIRPRGLPAEIANKYGDFKVERKQSLTCPRGMKDEDARLLPYLPVRTASDTDNLHNLPVATKEEANRHFIILIDATEEQKVMNLLKTEEMIKKAEDFKATNPTPEHNVQVQHVEQVEEDKTYDERKSHEEQEPKPEEELGQEKIETLPGEEEPKDESLHPQEEVDLSEEKKLADENEKVGETSGEETESSGEEESSGEDETSTSGDSDDEFMMGGGGMGGSGGSGGMMPGYGYGYPPTYPYQYPYAPYAQGQGDSKPQKSGLLKKNQGLNFDFLPHDNCCTEIELTIEPDDPDPLECAINNGIMPIVCCYMPPCLTLDPNSQMGAGATVNSQYSHPSQQGRTSTGIETSQQGRRNARNGTSQQGSGSKTYHSGSYSSGGRVPSYGSHDSRNSRDTSQAQPFVGSQFFPGTSPTFPATEQESRHSLSPRTSVGSQPPNPRVSENGSNKSESGSSHSSGLGLNNSSESQESPRPNAASNSKKPLPKVYNPTYKKYSKN